MHDGIDVDVKKRLCLQLRMRHLLLLRRAFIQFSCTPTVREAGECSEKHCFVTGVLAWLCVTGNMDMGTFFLRLDPWVASRIRTAPREGMNVVPIKRVHVHTGCAMNHCTI